MKVNVEKLDKNTVQLDIEIDAEIAAQEYNKACKRLGERISIPGFRKGKAPRNMIEKHVGVQQIQHEVIERLLPNVFADAISEHQFDLAGEPIVDSFNFELGKPLKVIAKLELKPEVNLGNYKGQVIEVPEFKQDEDAVEKEIIALAERFSTLEPVINRPTENNDLVVIDYNGTIDGEPIKGGAAKNHQLDLGKSNFIKGFAEQLIGKNIGEDFTINVTFPEDYFDAELSGKNAEFQVKINEIKHKIVPEINDELAQKVGPFQTIEELKNNIASFLQNTKDMENKMRSEKAVSSKIVDQAQVEIPDSMINREARLLMEEVQGRLKSQGVSWEQVLEKQGHENTWNSLREEASKRIKSSLVLGAIAKTENIQLTNEAFQEKVRELAVAYNTDEKAVYAQMSQNPGLAQALSQQVMSQQIINYLLENNEVKYIEDTLNTAE